MTASSEQKTTVFSGVFALVWIGEAVVTMQIKLLGGNMSAGDVQLDVWLHANDFTVLSSNPYASLGTLSSPWSLPPCSVRSIFLP